MFLISDEILCRKAQNYKITSCTLFLQQIINIKKNFLILAQKSIFKTLVHLFIMYHSHSSLYLYCTYKVVDLFFVPI